MQQFAVDRTVDHARYGERIEPERCQECQSLPTAIRREAFDPPAPRPPAPDRRHVRLDPGLVDEYEALGIEMRHCTPPPSTPPGDVSSVLLNR